MKNFYIATLLGSAAIAAAGYAWGQGIIPLASPTGTELLQVQPIQPNGQPGPFQVQVTLNQIRNATGYQLVATGGTVNTTVPNTTAKLLATGAITTWNVTLPTSPYDGEMLEVACPGGTATVAMTATLPAGVTIVGTAFTACTAGGVASVTAEWIYSTSANVWYRIQ